MGSVAENWGRKGVSKTVRVLKEEENGTDLATVSEVGLGKVLDNGVGVVAENRGRRGRPKKAKVLKNEAVEESGEVQERESVEILGMLSLYHFFIVSFFPILRMVITLYIYSVHKRMNKKNYHLSI